MRNRYFAAAVVAAAAAIAACAPARVRKPAQADTAATEKKDANQPDVDMSEASLRGSEFTNVDGLDPIYFDYDSAALKGTALETLKKNAEYLKQHSDIEVLVAGSCDERGTVEYNLALGQKRAKEVRDYYIRLGVSGGSVATISYGKEKPFCSEPTEACWASNRRAETKVRASTAANGVRVDRSTQ